MVGSPEDEYLTVPLPKREKLRLMTYIKRYWALAGGARRTSGGTSPPGSGRLQCSNSEMPMIDITERDFSIDDVVGMAKRPEVGAVVSFLGTVRDDGIEFMELEAYREAALPELERIRDEALNKFSLISVDIIHRIGSLKVGDNIVLIVCAAPHRRQAFEGCMYVIDELKARVALWKKEILSDGERWVRR